VFAKQMLPPCARFAAEQFASRGPESALGSSMEWAKNGVSCHRKSKSNEKRGILDVSEKLSMTVFRALFRRVFSCFTIY